MSVSALELKSFGSMFISIKGTLIVVSSFLLSVGLGYCTGHFSCCAQIWALSSRSFSQNSSCSCSILLNSRGLHLPFSFVSVAYALFFVLVESTTLDKQMTRITGPKFLVVGS